VNWSIAYLVIFPTAIGYVTWAVALKRLSAARATNFLYGVPPTATLIGFIWLGETPSMICDRWHRRYWRRCDLQCNAAEMT
jgi:drug/metabolite transporter (DMT)-like permease